MTKIDPKWRQKAKAALYAYPEYRQKVNDAYSSITTAGNDKIGGSCGVSKPTEELVLKALSTDEWLVYDAVERALRCMERRGQVGVETLRIIDMVYFKRSHKLYGATVALGLIDKTASRRHKNFIVILAKNLGFIK